MKIIAGILCFAIIWFIFVITDKPIIDKDPDNLNDNWF
jgi:hypothetical protein